jgi:predicted house-cleaning noncanonical NTP pyrophosphatase (MazG superfamily)
MKKYNKLVRDKIPDVIKKAGGVGKFHVADEGEYWQKLKEKLAEEVVEFFRDESVEELADILEVIEAIMVVQKISAKKLAAIKLKKRKERGAFKKRLILEES